MIKSLTKVGNSHAIILDRSLLDLVGLREDGQVQITFHNGSLIFTPVSPQVSDAEFDAIAEEVIRERREVLKRLAQ